MTGMWARVCEFCGAVSAAAPGAAEPAPEGWFHQQLAVFAQQDSIDVCRQCCETKTIAVLRDKLKERGAANVMANRP